MDSPKNPQLHLMRGKKKKKQAALNTHQEQFVVHSPSCVQLFVTPWMAAHQASLSFTISWSSLKFMSIQSYSYIVDNYISAYLVFLSMIVHNPMDFVYPIHISLVLTSQGTVDHQHQVWKSSVVVTLKVSFCGWNVYVPATFIC